MAAHCLMPGALQHNANHDLTLQDELQDMFKVEKDLAVSDLL